MAVANPAPPPDGYYWWTPEDPDRNVQIVHIERYGTTVEVYFMGTDISESWGNVFGMFEPVKPREGNR